MGQGHVKPSQCHSAPSKTHVTVNISKSSSKGKAEVASQDANQKETNLAADKKKPFGIGKNNDNY